MPKDANQIILVVIDMQRGFIESDGPIFLEGATNLINPIKKLVVTCRKYEVPVIWTRMSLDGFHKGPYRSLWPERFLPDGSNVFPKKSKWFEIVDVLSDLIGENDLIIDKDRYSAFYQTNLELRLRQQNIKKIIFCGVATNICVETTVRDAFQRDFWPYLVADCTKGHNVNAQLATEFNIRKSFGFVITSEEAFKIIKSNHIEPESETI